MLDVNGRGAGGGRARPGRGAAPRRLPRLWARAGRHRRPFWGAGAGPRSAGGGRWPAVSARPPPARPGRWPGSPGRGRAARWGRLSRGAARRGLQVRPLTAGFAGVSARGPPDRPLGRSSRGCRRPGAPQGPGLCLRRCSVRARSQEAGTGDPSRRSRGCVPGVTEGSVRQGLGWKSPSCGHLPASFGLGVEPGRGGRLWLFPPPESAAQRCLDGIRPLTFQH